MIELLHGDCLDRLKELPDNSVDSIVTDPPYELGFMGKAWDNTGIANNVELWGECLRVLKHGGHLLAFSGTRTYHRMACAIEDAGFEVRDMIEWVYGSGFPKSHSVGKAVDKLQGNEREVYNEEHWGRKNRSYHNAPDSDMHFKYEGTDDKLEGSAVKKSKGTSPFEGWGTALKPAHEPICMARKPLEKGLTVAENCLKWGTGGINVDASRVGTNWETDPTRRGWQGKANYKSPFESGELKGEKVKPSELGRFPANLILSDSEEVRACFPETKTNSHGKAVGAGYIEKKTDQSLVNVPFTGNKYIHTNETADSGNASRFFKSIIYQAKASKADRGKGNIHSTVKPTALMQYLITMVTPKGGTVLDPFMGSGTTGVAAVRDGFAFIGIEREAEYFEICKRRIEGGEPNEAEPEAEPERGPLDQPHKQLSLF